MVEQRRCAIVAKVQAKQPVDQLIAKLPSRSAAAELVALVASGDPEAEAAVIRTLSAGTLDQPHDLDEHVRAELYDAMEVTGSDPEAGLELGRKLTSSLVAPCELAQAWGIQAQAHRMLGQYTAAEKCLEEAGEVAGGCELAMADLLRRRGLVRYFGGRRREGLADADEAVALYRRLGSPGHDLDGEGLAKSLMARGKVRWHEGDFRGAIVDFGEAVSLIPPRKVVFVYAVANLAVALKDGGPEERLMAMDLLAPARHAFRVFPNGSLQRSKLDWVEGMLRWDLRRGKRAYARKLLLRAREYFIDKKMPFETAAVTADLFRMAFPDRSRLLELSEEWRPAFRRLVRAPDLRRAFGEVDRAAQAYGWDAERRLDRVISELRAACEAPGVIPCLLESRPSSVG